MVDRYQNIIDAIIEKAQRDCPDSLALIGVYGSCLTGDIHEKSDLDLLILINDDRGYCLSRTFIESGAGIGHDLYCTTWQMLESDAAFHHPHISKLMDSKILYCAADAFLTRLEALRQKATEADTRSAAEAALHHARGAFAQAMMADSMAQVRTHAWDMICHVLDTIALLNGRYFRLGVRRVFTELESMPLCPKNLKTMVDAILSATEVCQMQQRLLPLLRSVENLFLPTPSKGQPFPGTYEEMFSNWRNKMYLAAQTGDRFLSFDSLCSLNAMLKDLGYHWNTLEHFDPTDLNASAKVFDDTLIKFLEEYKKAGIIPEVYPTLDDFLLAYRKKETA